MRRLPIHKFALVGSTMQVAKDLIDQQLNGTSATPPATTSTSATSEKTSAVAFKPPCAILADQQTAGMGSGDRSWASPKGNMYLTIVVPKQDVPMDRLIVMPLIVGLCVHSAISLLLSSSSTYLTASSSSSCGARLKLKWPNDVLYDGKKISGSIIHEHKENLLIGIGINVACSPIISDEGRAATCVADILSTAAAEAAPPKVRERNTNETETQQEQLQKQGEEEDPSKEAVTTTTPPNFTTMSHELASLCLNEVLAGCCKDEDRKSMYPSTRLGIVTKYAACIDWATPVHRRLDGGKRGERMYPLRLTEYGQLVVVKDAGDATTKRGMVPTTVMEGGRGLVGEAVDDEEVLTAEYLF